MNSESLIIIGIAIMLMMALAVVFFVFLYQRRSVRHELELKIVNEQKQMELLQASIQSEEEERMRIAGELHDDVGATLSSIRLFLHKAAEGSPNASLIFQSRDLLDASISKIRDISHKLQPATLQSLGLYASLESYAETLNRAGLIKFFVESVNQIPRLSTHTELHVYRIIQELITNTVKYAHATGITVQMSSNSRSMSIRVVHDGVGIAQEDYETLLNKSGAIGLKNIVNRLKFISGTMHFGKTEGKQYETVIIIPITE